MEYLLYLSTEREREFITSNLWFTTILTEDGEKITEGKNAAWLLVALRRLLWYVFGYPLLYQSLEHRKLLLRPK